MKKYELRVYDIDIPRFGQEIEKIINNNLEMKSYGWSLAPDRDINSLDGGYRVLTVNLSDEDCTSFLLKFNLAGKPVECLE